MNEHPQNTYLAKIVNANRSLLEKVQVVQSVGLSDNDGQRQWGKAVQEMLDLQDAVNCYIDSSKMANKAGPNEMVPAGIKQATKII